jgi:hypothetical protein
MGAGTTTLCQSRLDISQSGTKNLASADSILSPLLPGVQKRCLRRCICISGSGSLFTALSFARWPRWFKRTVSKTMYFWIRITAPCSYLCSLVPGVQKDGCLRRFTCTSGSGSLLPALTFARWSLGFKRTSGSGLLLTALTFAR